MPLDRHCFGRFFFVFRKTRKYAVFFGQKRLFFCHFSFFSKNRVLLLEFRSVTTTIRYYSTKKIIRKSNTTTRLFFFQVLALRGCPFRSILQLFRSVVQRLCSVSQSFRSDFQGKPIHFAEHSQRFRSASAAFLVRITTELQRRGIPFSSRKSFSNRN